MHTEIMSTILYDRSVFQHLRFANVADELMCCHKTSSLYLQMKCHQRHIGNARYCDKYLYCSKKKTSYTSQSEAHESSSRRIHYYGINNSFLSEDPGFGTGE